MTTGITVAPLGPELVIEDVIGTSIAGVLGVLNTDSVPIPSKTAPGGVLEFANVTFVGRRVGVKVGKVGDVALAVVIGVVMLAAVIVPIGMTPAGGGAGTVEFAH
jgi:hypothetical protein